MMRLSCVISFITTKQKIPPRNPMLADRRKSDKQSVELAWFSRPSTLASDIIRPLIQRLSVKHPWRRRQMEIFSALLAICAGNSPVAGEFPAQGPVTRSFDVFFDLRLNKRLSKQSWGWWFETLSRPLWLHCNALSSNKTIDSSPPSAAYMRQWIESALVKIMACRLFCTRPLPKPILGYCQLDT